MTVLRDLRRAIISLPNSVKLKNVVVYGGGVVLDLKIH